MWLSILVIILLLLGFLGGFKKGAIKSFFSLASLLIAIFLAGLLYHLTSHVLFFLPGENWENFLGFFITLAVVSIALHFVFLLPRKFLQTVVFEGFLLRILGGALGLFQAAIGLEAFAILVYAYPIAEWLKRAVVDSGVLNWLIAHLGFVQAMLPSMFQGPLDVIIA